MLAWVGACDAMMSASARLQGGGGSGGVVERAEGRAIMGGG